MTVKELIAELQQYDGELEVCTNADVGNDVQIVDTVMEGTREDFQLSWLPKRFVFIE